MSLQHPKGTPQNVTKGFARGIDLEFTKKKHVLVADYSLRLSYFILGGGGVKGKALGMTLGHTNHQLRHAKPVMKIYQTIK